jgi:outer membrane protein assembly factor BamA
MTTIVALAIILGFAQPQPPASPTECGAEGPPPQECISEVRLHGNHTTPDAEVLRLAAVQPGQPFVADTLDRIRKALQDSGRFRSVDVRKRYASLTDTSAVLIVIVVEEEVGIAIDVPNPGPMRKLRANTMWLPILRSDDGYGFTYGVRVSFVDVLGKRTRLSAPLSWGGERRAAVEVERRFARGPLTRVIGTAGITRREHPTLDLGDRRAGAGIRAERALTSWLQLAGAGAVSDVRFGEVDDRFKTVGGDVVLDTRRDPAFPRNALYATVGVQRLWFDTSADTVRVTADARGFVGLFGQTVLALRAQHVRAADPLPVFEQSLLGGDATLRGFKLGYRLGDRLLAGSAEIRLPLSTPRHLTRLGVAVFADTGTVYGAREPLDQAVWDTGVGAGVFLQAPLVGLRLDVARGLGSGTRVHFSLGATF